MSGRSVNAPRYEHTTSVSANLHTSGPKAFGHEMLEIEERPVAYRLIKEMPRRGERSKSIPVWWVSPFKGTVDWYDRNRRKSNSSSDTKF
jgi:hypothetical protein